MYLSDDGILELTERMPDILELIRKHVSPETFRKIKRDFRDISSVMTECLHLRHQNEELVRQIQHTERRENQ